MRLDEQAQHCDVRVPQKRKITEVVDAAAINQRVFTLPREVLSCKNTIQEVSRGHSTLWNTSQCSEEKRRINLEVSRAREGLNIGLLANSGRNPAQAG